MSYEQILLKQAHKAAVRAKQNARRNPTRVQDARRNPTRVQDARRNPTRVQDARRNLPNTE
jgi:hypothetical protein